PLFYRKSWKPDLRSKGRSYSGRISIETFEHFRKWKWKYMATSCICAPTFAGYATRYCRPQVSRRGRRSANDRHAGESRCSANTQSLSSNSLQGKHIIFQSVEDGYNCCSLM